MSGLGLPGRAAVLIHQRRAAGPRYRGRGSHQNRRFPNAQVKVFLTADPRERARRRVLQRHQNDAQPLTAEQLEAEVDETLDALKQRDKLDSSREVAPLVPAEDAVHVDSTAHTIDEVVRIIEDLINQRR
ncbi:MAG: (d)CMP kinase [Collinsella aerofaciens]